MDVKIEFLNDFLREEMYVKQPSNFEDVKYFEHLYKLKKYLYGLKQTPVA